MKSNPQKIVYVLNTLNSNSGTHTILRELLRNSSDNIEYFIVNLSKNKQIPDHLKEQLNKAKVIHIYPNNRIKLKILSPFIMINTVKKLIHIIIEIKPAVIVADGGPQTYIFSGLTGSLLKNKLKNMKIIFRFGNVYSQSRNIKSFNKILLKILERFVFRWCPDLVIFPSNYSKTDFINSVKLNVNKAKVIVNPINLNFIEEKTRENGNPHPFFDNKNFVFISVGSLSKRKGTITLIDAFKDVAKEHEEARLLIIGEGDQQSILEQKIRDLDLENSVNLIGYQSNPYKYIALSSTLVHPALWEGFGIVLIESFACGTPVITTSGPGGPKEVVIDNYNGIIVPPENSRQLADSMTKLLKDRELREHLSVGSLESSKQYSSLKVVKEYEKEFMCN